jgi:hypothetical protein
LMCSEKDPLNCHRFSMISYQLVKEGFSISHILANGSIISNEILEKEMLIKYQKKIPQSDLFNQVTLQEQVEAAYRLCGQDVAYRPTDKNAQEIEEDNL